MPGSRPAAYGSCIDPIVGRVATTGAGVSDIAGRPAAQPERTGRWPPPRSAGSAAPRRVVRGGDADGGAPCWVITWPVSVFNAASRSVAGKCRPWSISAAVRPRAPAGHRQRHCDAERGHHGVAPGPTTARARSSPKAICPSTSRSVGTASAWRDTPARSSQLRSCVAEPSSSPHAAATPARIAATPIRVRSPKRTPSPISPDQTRDRPPFGCLSRRWAVLALPLCSEPNPRLRHRKTFCVSVLGLGTSP
jgi:hypothetical protein